MGRSEKPAGCLGTALGELAAYLGLGVVVGLGTAVVAMTVAVGRARPALGVTIGVVLAATLAYGLVLTVRVRPGLYLENVVGRAASEEHVRRLGTGRHRRLKLVAMGLAQVTLVAAGGYVLLLAVFGGG